MTTSAAQIRAFTGPVLLSYGFRPFFLFGALWAALAVAVWLPILSGHLVLPGALGPVEWHVHELVFGYGAGDRRKVLADRRPNWIGVCRSLGHGW